VRYPEPDALSLDPSFAKYKIAMSTIERRALLASEEAYSGRGANRAISVSVGEAHPLGGQPVHVGCLVVVTPNAKQIRLTQIIR